MDRLRLVFVGIMALIIFIFLGYVIINPVLESDDEKYIYTDLSNNEGYSPYCFIDNNIFKKDTQRCFLQNGREIVVKSFRLNEGE